MRTLWVSFGLEENQEVLAGRQLEILARRVRAETAQHQIPRVEAGGVRALSGCLPGVPAGEDGADARVDRLLRKLDTRLGAARDGVVAQLVGCESKHCKHLIRG